MGFNVYKALALPTCSSRAAPVPVDVRDLWVAPQAATPSTQLEDMCGFHEECSDSEAREELLQVVAMNSAGTPPHVLAPSQVSEARGVSAMRSKYNFDGVILKALQGNTLHECA